MVIDGEQLLIRAENEFRPLRQVELRAGTVTAFSEWGAIAVSTPDAAVEALQRWKAEAHALFFGNRDSLRRVVLANSGGRSVVARSADSYQGSYMRDPNAGPFYFLGDGHPSVEVLGTSAAVLGCLCVARAMVPDSARPEGTREADDPCG